MCTGICGHLFPSKIEWCPGEGNQSHSANLDRLGLADKHPNPDYIAFEVWPRGTLDSTDPVDWTFRVDENSPRPDWFKEAVEGPLVIAEHCKRWATVDRVDYPGSLDLGGTGVKDVPASICPPERIIR